MACGARDMTTGVREAEAALRATIASLERVVVAYSGGVDSAVVMAAAARALAADRVLAVTAASPSVAMGEVEAAAALARRLGVAHRVVATSEFENEAYRANGADRCFHCKHELYDVLGDIARDRSACIVDGSNADDGAAPLDRRPGRAAAARAGVRSPLCENGIGKQTVRAIASSYGLAVAQKPATPCLSSRVPYGTRIEFDDLRRIDLAERYLRASGFETVRVRHYGACARIEVPVEQVARLTSMSERVAGALRAVGYRTIEIDERGYRTGSLNDIG